MARSQIVSNNFTQGGNLKPLLRFSLPILLALILQTAYGAVDLWMVSTYATAADVSAVSTGAQLMMSITSIITGLTMGTTVLMGQTLGQGHPEEVGPVIGGSIALFSLLSLLLTALVVPGAGVLAQVTHAPQAAFQQTATYIRVCGGGLLFIAAYNVFGSIFRGMGDSRTPLMTVAIAAAANMAGDYILVALLGLGALGAALATVGAQALSVLISLLVVRRRGLPFPFSAKNIRFRGTPIGRVVRLGAPVALQDGLVSISFLVILSIVNSLGLIASAGVGVAEKLCGFIMLVPSAFSQSVTTFVAQNVGAGKLDRARKVLWEGVLVSLLFGVVIGGFSFFRGDLLSRLFSQDGEIVAASASYLKAYAIDVLLTSFLFPFMGYFNGRGKTGFVMAQGLVGAFAVRIPVSFLMARWEPVTLFHVGLATPCSTLVQILLCGAYFLWLEDRDRSALARPAAE